MKKKRFKIEKIFDESPPTYNFNFFLREIGNNQKWVAKISRSVKDLDFAGFVNFIDFDDRAMLNHRLALLVEANVPRAEFISFSQIVPSGPLRSELLNHPDLNSDNFLFNKDRLFITKFEGMRLNKYLENNSLSVLTNLDKAIKNIIFNIWVGNYDNKNDDYIVNKKDQCYSIDYNIAGPGFHANDELALGYCAQSYSLNEPEDTGYATCEVFLEHIKSSRFTLDYFQDEISIIESVEDDLIRDCFEDLNFVKHTSHENINEVYLHFIINRKPELRKVVEAWCNSGYLRGQDRGRQRANIIT